MEKRTMNRLNASSAGLRLVLTRLGARADRVLQRLEQERPRYPQLDVLPEDGARVLMGYGRRCAYCGKTGADGNEVSIDLLVPARRGGTNHPANLVAACQTCRRARQGKHLDAFLEERLDLDARAVYDRIARASATLRGVLRGDRGAE